MGIPFFRKIDRQFCIVDFVPVHAVLFAGRNGADTNSINALLCKAYIDVYMGLTYEVLAAVNYDDESAKITVIYKLFHIDARRKEWYNNNEQTAGGY